MTVSCPPVFTILQSKIKRNLAFVRKYMLVVAVFMGLMAVSGSVIAGGVSSLGFLGVGAIHIVLMYVFHFLLRAK